MLTQDTRHADHPATPAAAHFGPAASVLAASKPALSRSSAGLGDEFPEAPLLRDSLPDDESLGEHDLNLERLLRADNEALAELNITLLNVPYRADKAGFDGAVLDAFFRGKQVEAAREYFYVVDGRPHLSCWIEWTEPEVDRDSSADPIHMTRASSGRRKSGDPARRAAKAHEHQHEHQHADQDADQEFAVAMNDTQQRVFDGLRAWRLGRARELGIPAYRVLTNRVMERIARANPATVEQLTAIPGVGPATAETHGHAIVAVAANFTTVAAPEPADPIRSPPPTDLTQQEATPTETPQHESPPKESLPKESLKGT